ncbi:sigma-E factor negative regulatory protein [Limnobacter sp.]|uniref:sigma-E factor negative regulatory protein n=1 Tax=Limnobacter sp. TaxID=2003368 RepID=UPI00351326FF
MTERKEQLSAMLDGELGETQLASVLKSLGQDDVSTYASYALVGDLLRSSELLTLHKMPLVDRIEAALDLEPTVLAPVLATEITRQNRIAQALRMGRSRRFVAAVAAIGFFSFALNQAVPPQHGQLQMVRTTPVVESNFSDEELALWQEYFMAHQQNSVRSGLAGVSPIARVEADRPSMQHTVRVNVDELEATEWMNVWDSGAYSNNPAVQFNYVSSGR